MGKLRLIKCKIVIIKLPLATSSVHRAVHRYFFFSPSYLLEMIPNTEEEEETRVSGNIYILNYLHGQFQSRNLWGN